MSPRRARILSWVFGVLALAALVYLIWPVDRSPGAARGISSTAGANVADPPASPTAAPTPTETRDARAAPVARSSVGDRVTVAMPVRPPDEPPDFGPGGDPRLHPPTPPIVVPVTEELAPEVLRARQLVQILALRELAEAGTLDDTAADQDWTQLQQLETWAAESDITDREWVAARDELDQRRATAAAAGEPRRP